MSFIATSLMASLVVASLAQANLVRPFYNDAAFVEADAPFSLCGTALMFHILDHNMCDVKKCADLKREALLSNRVLRAPVEQTVTDLCCAQPCRPSQVQRLCCEGI